MKSTLVALSLSALSFAASADVTPFTELDNFVSTRTRAEVRAEVIAALAAGERIFRGEGSYDEQTPFVSTKTREQVAGEVRELLSMNPGRFWGSRHF